MSPGCDHTFDVFCFSFIMDILVLFGTSCSVCEINVPSTSKNTAFTICCLHPIKPFSYFTNKAYQKNVQDSTVNEKEHPNETGFPFGCSARYSYHGFHRLSLRHTVPLPDSPCERRLAWGRASILSDDRQSSGGALCAPQYSWSKISTISPMTPSSQWHSTRAPQSFTSWAQLAGAKGMTDLASMGMSFWLSPTQ